MLDDKSGFDEFERVLWKLIDVLAGIEAPVLVAGDFNLHPDHVRPLFEEFEMDDALTILDGFPPRTDGINGRRVWTHRNTDYPGGSVQELDFIFVNEELKRELVDVEAGVQSFPTAFERSDHAPVVAYFRR